MFKCEKCGKNGQKPTKTVTKVRSVEYRRQIGRIQDNRTEHVSFGTEVVREELLHQECAPVAPQTVGDMLTRIVD